MNIFINVLDFVGRVFFGYYDWDRVKATIERVENDPITGSLSGAEKKQEAINQFEVIGLTIAGWLANFAIEAAVAYLRKRSEEE